MENLNYMKTITNTILKQLMAFQHYFKYLALYIQFASWYKITNYVANMILNSEILAVQFDK